MNILSFVFANIGAVCLWLAVISVMTGSLNTDVSTFTPAQTQAFWLTGGAVLCFVWAITIAGWKRGDK